MVGRRAVYPKTPQTVSQWVQLGAASLYYRSLWLAQNRRHCYFQIPHSEPICYTHAYTSLYSTNSHVGTTCVGSDISSLMQTDVGKVVGEKKKNQEQWEAMLLVAQWSAMSDMSKKNNPSILNSCLWLSFFFIYAESWQGFRYLHMWCPLGTGSWQNWELSTGPGWWDPSCWKCSHYSWGLGCYCLNLVGPFYSLLQLNHGTCHLDVPCPVCLLRSFGSVCHHQRLTPPSPCMLGSWIFGPVPLAQPSLPFCSNQWFPRFCLHSL